MYEKKSSFKIWNQEFWLEVLTQSNPTSKYTQQPFDCFTVSERRHWAVNLKLKNDLYPLWNVAPLGYGSETVDW